MAEVHQDYLDYLVGARITDYSVLRLQTFGPVNVENSEHMKAFAIFMTAVTLYFEEKRANQSESHVT